ncbi:MAG TPA: CPBP family intramembrane glutamic endopeptidase [Pyrinomonadaceae bacterium]|nr:CPBP family intramembrane glutamic endopeptidase [Pyrinomonadaceae bacterium]
MRRIFINDFGRLRSGWRVLVFILAFFAALFLLATVLRVAYLVLHNVGPTLPGQAFLADAIFRITLLTAALAAGYLCARLLEGLPWRSLGLTFHKGWLRDLLVGCAIGFAALAVAVGIATAAGGLRFSFGGSGFIVPMLRSLVGAAVLLFVAALAEEALFRGYVLQTFTRAQLTLLGVLLTSVPFALVHLSNPNVVPGVTFANTALAGIWLAAAYLRTRSLWFPLGVHWAWNWALGSFFGLPISGINLVSNPVFKGNDVGPAWLTGGSYGIEGGVACTVALVAFTLFIWRTRWVSADAELKKLTSEENPAIPTPVITIRPADDVA